MIISGIAFFYIIMCSIELIALHSRFAGYTKKKFAIGYTLYNTTMAFTRMFYMFMMPMLGYLIDKGVDTKHYLMLTIVSLFSVAIIGFFIRIKRSVFVVFYCKVIEHYMSGGGLIKAVFRSFESDGLKVHFKNESKIDISLLTLSTFIYSIHSIGIFATYFIALTNPDYRVTITQLSAVVNSIATAMLTIKLEPMLSRSMEADDSFISKFDSVYIGRLIAFSVISPSIMLLTFVFV